MKPSKFISAFAFVTLSGLLSGPATMATAVAQTSNVDFDITFDHAALSMPDVGESIAW